MDFGILGPLIVWRAGVPVDVGTPKARVLLAVLLCRSVAGDALAESIWGEEQPKSAAKNVQTYVHRLRQRLGDPARITWEDSALATEAARLDELLTQLRTEAGLSLKALAARFEAAKLWGLSKTTLSRSCNGLTCSRPRTRLPRSSSSAAKPTPPSGSWHGNARSPTGGHANLNHPTPHMPGRTPMPHRR